MRLGGAERVVTLLLQQLPRERFELHLGLVEAAGEFLAQVPQQQRDHALGAAEPQRGDEEEDAPHGTKLISRPGT